jgi:uncharacterized protein
MTKARKAGAIALVAIVTLLVAARADAQPDPPQLTDTVNDFAGVIDAASKRELDSIIRRLQAASGDAIVVATIKTFEPWGDIRTYAVKMFENHGRGIGQKGRDNGLLVLLAVDDRRVWVEVGYDLEGIITDGFAGETSREVMTPSFRGGQYGQGLLYGVSTIAGRIADARNVTLDNLPQARRAPRRESGIPVIVWIVLALVIFNVIRGVTGSGMSGRRRRGRWDSHVGPFGAGYGGWSGGSGGWGGGGGFGGGFGGFGGGRSGGGGGGASW